MLHVECICSSYIEEFVQKKPRNVLLGGHFGCGKTVVGSQFFSIRISELELSGKRFRVIIGADVVHEDSKLLLDLKNNQFSFLETEINQRREFNGQEKIDVTFTTVNSLIEKHGIVPGGTAKDIEATEKMVSKKRLAQTCN